MDFRIEELSMNAWPALATRLYDGWILRMSGGYTMRSNSVNPIYPSRLPSARKIAYCEAAYAAAGLPAAFKLAECEEHAALDRELESRGYAAASPTAVRVLEGLPEFGAAPEGVRVDGDFPDGWAAGFLSCAKGDAKREGILKAMLRNVGGARIVATLQEDGETAGCGFGAVDDGWVGIFSVAVREDSRGRGYGRRIMDAILSAAARAGAERSYLQVECGNAPAESLYERLGYREAYRYRYRKQAPGA